MKQQADRFNDQAQTFESRAGLDLTVGRAVAQAVQNRFSLCPNDVLLEIGAGTGTIGRHFAELSVSYVGMDLSRSMLRSCQRNRPGASGRMLLVQADGNATWPVRSHSVSVVFASRVVHLLDAAHLVHEFKRAGRPGGYLAIGRVTREADALRSRLRRRKRAILAEHGLHSSDGMKKSEELVARCLAGGAALLEPTTVARWTRRTTAEEVISEWEGRPDFGGVQIHTEFRTALFRELRAWACREFGSLDRPESSVYSYTIGGVRLP